jgi:predicted pyridoxine 5'-phosphate oxidase superfamily flavin-nucleotide-binding protein
VAYHSGEIAAQARAGVREEATRIGNILVPNIPASAQSFLLLPQMVVVSTLDAQGRIWASLLVGEPGFLRAVNPTTLEIHATPRPGDPLGENLRPSAFIGMIAIDPLNTKRFRINGRILEFSERLLVRTEQVYINCPKYIQRRELTVVGGSNEGQLTSISQTRRLSQQQQEEIRRADTFFIASINPESGADASHRGGNPGFVHVLGEDLLLFPDYAGNTMFQTFGNLILDSRAGLLFINFMHGGTLQLTGKANIIWDEKLAASLPGAQRLVLFEIASVIESNAGNTVHGRLITHSPYNPK